MWSENLEIHRCNSTRSCGVSSRVVSCRVHYRSYLVSAGWDSSTRTVPREIWSGVELWRPSCYEQGAVAHSCASLRRITGGAPPCVARHIAASGLSDGIQQYPDQSAGSL